MGSSINKKVGLGAWLDRGSCDDIFLNDG